MLYPLAFRKALSGRLSPRKLVALTVRWGLPPDSYLRKELCTCIPGDTHLPVARSICARTTGARALIHGAIAARVEMHFDLSVTRETPLQASQAPSPAVRAATQARRRT
jgi:hypothetical protein